MNPFVTYKLPIECNAFDCFLTAQVLSPVSMATKAITTMSTTITAMAMVATLEPPPMGCAVVASGLLVVPRFVVAVVESPSVILSLDHAGSSVVVASVVTCSVMGVQ